MVTQDERARVLIIDPRSGHTAECNGATAFGACPRVPEGQIVPCAGCRVVPGEGTGLEGWVLSVASDAADGCPLAFLPLRDGR